VRRNRALMLVAACLLAAALAGVALVLPGCGKKGGSSVETSQPSTTAPGKATTSPSQQGTTPSGTQTTQPSSADTTAATDAAMASAKANNPALGPLNVLAVKIVDGWARVDMQAADRSTDAASWFLKKTGGQWVVVDFGTSVIPADHPDAPAELFK
jgi:hypothetical protein